MKDYSCIVLDDDSISLTIVSKLLSEYGSFNLLETIQNPEVAFAYLLQNKVDLLIIDVDLNGVNGIELLGQLPNKISAIVISSYDEYAIQAFNASVLDYVLKPLQKIRFFKALSKAVDDLNRGKTSSNTNTTNENAIFVRKNDSYVKVTISDIQYLHSDGDYIEIFTQDTKYLIISTMDTLLGKINSSDFLRVHRSYAVPISKVQSFQDHDLYIGKHVIPVSKSYVKVVKEQLNII
ncbi:MAG: response regulator transcription factor [Bacteroidetes bacterium]|nr:response regulator transcription factor [Bacteroidota bacterium]